MGSRRQVAPRLKILSGRELQAALSNVPYLAHRVRLQKAREFVEVAIWLNVANDSHERLRINQLRERNVV